MAFEEQLGRNRNLVKQIAELVAIPSHQPSRSSRAKAALKWLVKQLNEGKLFFRFMDPVQRFSFGKKKLLSFFSNNDSTYR